MKINPTNPPAIVKEAESLAELIAQAQAIFGQQKKARRLDLEKTLNLGEILLKAKAKCKHGQWLPTLEKIGVGRSAAGEAIRARQITDSVISTCESMADVRRLWRGAPDQDETEIPEEIIDDGCGQEDAEPEEPPATPPKRNTAKRRCANCTWREEAGKPMPENCRECAALNGATAAPSSATPAPPATPPVAETNGMAASEPATPETPSVPAGPPPLTDEMKTVVPEPLIPIFEKAKEFKEIVNQLNAINRKLKELHDSPAGTPARLQGEQIDLRNLKESVHFDMPYAICPICHGDAKKRKANCQCKGRGWLVQTAYKNLPKEYQKEKVKA
jgi:hypothetical protein